MRLGTFRFVQHVFWTAVMKLGYYLGKLSSPSPGTTNLQFALKLNYYGLVRLWKMEDYKVGWLFRMVENRQIAGINREISRAKERSSL